MEDIRFEEFVAQLQNILDSVGLSIVRKEESIENVDTAAEESVNQANEAIIIHQQNPNSKIHYVIDKTNKTVIAVMLDAETEVLQEMTHLGLPIKYPQNYLLKVCYQGKAKCAPEDMFNIEVGKTIARARLLKKYYKDKERVLADYSIDEFFATINNLKKIRLNATNRFHKFYNEEKEFTNPKEGNFTFYKNKLW